VSKNNDLERKALKLVVDAGEEGILQSDLWKSLDVTSREGSRISLKFAEKEVIERRKVLHNGRWTYKLFNLTKYVSLESIRTVHASSAMRSTSASSEARSPRSSAPSSPPGWTPTQSYLRLSRKAETGCRFGRELERVLEISFFS